MPDDGLVADGDVEGLRRPAEAVLRDPEREVRVLAGGFSNCGLDLGIGNDGAAELTEGEGDPDMTRPAFSGLPCSIRHASPCAKEIGRLCPIGLYRHSIRYRVKTKIVRGLLRAVAGELNLARGDQAGTDLEAADVDPSPPAEEEQAGVGGVTE